MKIKSDLYAGMTYEQCDSQRNYWKQAAKSPYCTGYNPNPYPPTPYPPVPYPPAPKPPVPSGGGYVGGVYYPDRSGTCG